MNTNLTFIRKRYAGVSTKTTGYVSADLNSAVSRVLDADRLGSGITVSPSNEYIFYSFSIEKS